MSDAQDDVEKQIDRAMKHWAVIDGRDDFRQLLRDLLAGKFKEEPLPEIAAVPWPHGTLELGQNSSGHFVSTHGVGSWTGTLEGPYRPTPRAAIEAWNAVFAKRDER